MTRIFPTLTSRLVLTAVLLVAAVAVLIGSATAVAMRDSLTGQLDRDVSAGLERVTAGPGTGPPDSGTGEPGRFGNQAPDTLIALTDPSGVTAPWATVLGTGYGGDRVLGERALQVLDDVTTGAAPRTVDLPGVGRYRVQAVEVSYRNGTEVGTATLLVGLPLTEVDAAVESLIWWEALFALLGVAGAVALGSVVVRRQLRPLREVAATAHRVSSLPLAAGDTAIDERVPAGLTDEATEVGQVGGALNRLLDHVEGALEARQRSESRVRRFVADASHELRTPLTTIRGYAELARRRPDDADAARLALGKVEQESAVMTDLVEDLLLLARLDSGRPLDRAPVDLTELLVDLVSDARVLAPEHTWRLQLPASPVTVPGDAGRLRQVFTNLLTNAHKYTPAGTVVVITAVEPGPESISVTVHDDGPGFPPDLVEHAFERFTRGDAARTRSGGAGLGLSLVQAIVSAHGGSVGLTSSPGDTTLTVALPTGP